MAREACRLDRHCLHARHSEGGAGIVHSPADVAGIVLELHDHDARPRTQTADELPPLATRHRDIAHVLDLAVMRGAVQLQPPSPLLMPPPVDSSSEKKIVVPAGA